MLAEAVALAVRQVIEVSSGGSEVLLAAVQVLEIGARSKNNKLAKAVALKLPFVKRLSDEDTPFEIAALKVLEAGARSKNAQLAEAVAAALKSRFMDFSRLISLHNSEVQLSALKVI